MQAQFSTGPEQRHQERYAHGTNAQVLPESIDFSRPFMPEELSPLYFTPAYRTLTPSQKLRYNQISALYFNEQTMFFEKALARNVLGYFLAQSLPPSLKEGLRQFLVEEERHTEMFRRLNQLAAAEFYGSGRHFHFIQTPPLAASLLDAMSRCPQWFPLLLWLMHLQEERAIFFGKAFLNRAAVLEPHFVEVQRTHLADEIGHVRWDVQLLDFTWARTGRLTRRLNVRLFAWMIREYFTTPKRSAPRIITALVKEFPELRSRHDELCRQLLNLGHNAAYQRSLYCPENVPETFKRFDAWPEFKLMTTAMPGYCHGTHA